MRSKVRSALCSLVVLFLVFAGLLAQTVVIYHTSDVHGWYVSRRSTLPDGSSRQIGGYAALSALVKKEQNPYILLDSGDLYQGTPEGNFSKGMASIDLMNLLGYRAMALGNHEYDYGEENVRTLAGAARFPFLAANIRVAQTDLAPDYVRPYTIIELGGRRLGILGLANSTTPTQTLRSNVEGLEFQLEDPTAERLVPEIRKHGVDAVVLLAHGVVSDSLSVKRLKVSEDLGANIPKDLVAMARAIAGIDVILGGHYHTGLDEGYRDPESGTLIVGSFHTLLAASRVQLDFDPETGRLKSASSRLIDLDVSQTGEDPQVLELLRPYEERVERVMGEKIGEVAEDLDEAALAGFINEVMRTAAGADVAVQNPGGIRTQMHKGPVTLADVYRVMPFDNTLVTVELTGSQIVELLRQSPLYISGVQARWPDGQARRAQVEVTMNGSPLDPNRIFRVATNNYLAYGASDILTGGGNKTDTRLIIRDLMVKAIKSSSPLQRPSPDCITKLPVSAGH